MRRAARLARELLSIGRGYAAFRAGGSTPDAATRSLRWLYCETDGRFNDVVAWIVGRLNPPRPDEAASGGVLGPMAGGKLAGVVEALTRDGFHVFDATLPPDLLEALREVGHRLPCAPTRRGGRGPVSRPYPELRGTSSRYDLDMAMLCQEEPIQRLLADASIRAVAAGYLACEPVLDLALMWWSEPPPPGEDLTAEAAQQFHFDMDRLKFIKFFFYLTDVGPETGPHCLIRRSHRRKPRATLVDGRQPDAWLRAHFAAEDFVEVCGPRGTILAVDTRAFHKGKPLLRGARLLAQLEFSVSAFGMAYPTLSVTPALAPLAAAVRAHPRTFSRVFNAGR